MKIRLTCNDCIQAMAREVITVSAETLDEAWDELVGQIQVIRHGK